MSFTVAMKVNIVFQKLNSLSYARIVRERLVVVTRISAFEERILISDAGTWANQSNLALVLKTKRQIVGVLERANQEGLEVFRLQPVRPNQMGSSLPFNSVKGEIDFLSDSKKSKLSAEFLVLHRNSQMPKCRMFLRGSYTPWVGEIFEQ